jgi:hypothetical protein
MSTQTLHVACNARPMRLAFIVDKPEPTVLEEVFRLNTLLWGGLFNPAVVFDLPRFAVPIIMRVPG